MTFPNLHIERGHDPAWKKGPPDRVPTVGSAIDDLDETFASGGYVHQGGRLLKTIEMLRAGLEGFPMEAPLERNDLDLIQKGYTIGELHLAKQVAALGELAKTVGKPHLHQMAERESMAVSQAITKRFRGMQKDCEAYMWDVPECRCTVTYTADIESDHPETVRFQVRNIDDIERVLSDEDEALLDELMETMEVA